MAVYTQKPTRGRRQVQMQINRQYGIHMSLGSVHRYMSILNIRSKRIKRYKPQNKADVKPHIFPNVVQQAFDANYQQKWLTDITYLPCKDGIIYLSCIKDLYDKSIIAYAMSNKNDLRLVLNTLDKASPNFRDGLILHSDQGHQYSSHGYHNILKLHGIIGSMSRKGNPYDNSPMESFFSILKNEELKLYKRLTVAQTKKVVAQFIDYYNTNRPQWGLKKMTPAEFRNHLH